MIEFDLIQNAVKEIYRRRYMKRSDRKHLQEALKDDPSCYVLITCSQPLEDGTMQVKMIYQGEALLASYLLQGAQSFFLEEEQNCIPQQKIVHLAEHP